LALKGLNPAFALGWGALLLLWFGSKAASGGKGDLAAAHPLGRLLIIAFLCGLMWTGMLGPGSVADAVDLDAWWAFIPFAVFDLLGLYLLLGAGLWAFLGASSTPSGRRQGGSMLLVIAILLGGLSAYVAALWAVEGQAWGLAWWKTMVVLGNNGRHGMVLLPAVLWSAVHLRGDAPLPTERLHRAFVFILPLALLAAAHGQTMWTDDAAEAALEHLEEGDDLLLIHDPALAVHWLYSMHPVLSEQGPDGLVGHWRAPGAGWEDEVLNGTVLPNRGDLSSVAVIVIAPDLEVTLEGWVEAEVGEAPWMNGGGAWRILVPAANP